LESQTEAAEIGLSMLGQQDLNETEKEKKVIEQKFGGIYKRVKKK